MFFAHILLYESISILNFHCGSLTILCLCCTTEHTKIRIQYCIRALCVYFFVFKNVRACIFIRLFLCGHMPHSSNALHFFVFIASSTPICALCATHSLHTIVKQRRHLLKCAQISENVGHALWFVT